jgi:uncharacterized protein (TIGR02147 family)
VIPVTSLPAKRAPSPTQFGSCGEYLGAVLGARVRRNPRYSLRSFAAQLEIEPSFLSAVLRGKKNLSVDRAQAVAQRLRLEDGEREAFCLVAQMDGMSNPELRQQTLKKIREMFPSMESESLTTSEFCVFDDWICSPILELAARPRLRVNATVVSERLGVSRRRADEALQALCKAGFLRRCDDGSYVNDRTRWRAESRTRHAGLADYHHRMLAKTQERLRTLEPAQRLVGTLTFSLAPRQLGEVERMAREFVSRVHALSEEAGEDAEVFHLGVQAFPVTRPMPKALPT